MAEPTEEMERGEGELLTELQSVLSILIQLKPFHAAAGFKVESEHQELHVILYIQPPSLEMGYYYLCQKLLLNLIQQ